MEIKLSDRQKKHELWRRGVLLWKMHAGQKEMYKIYTEAKPNSTLTWLVSRRFGKSYLLTVLALEQAIKKKNSIIKIVTDTKVHAKSIFDPLFRDILEDCPDDIKPNYLESQYKYVFANGSEIQLAGSDGGHYQRLRGQQSDLVLIDEAGFCDSLNDVVWSVLFPTLLHTGGKMVLASTPSTDPDHEFNKFIEKAEIEGHLTKKTIYDNPLLSQEQINIVIKEMNGVDDPKFMREYLCIPVRDETTTVFPEFDDDLQKLIVKDWPKQPYYDAYVGMDIGYKDLTGVVFLYYDFKADKIIVEDEIVLAGKDLKLPDLAKEIVNKEESLWKNPLTNELKNPRRVSDINHIVTQEINRASNYQVYFDTAKKDDPGGMINQLRVLIANQKVIINPRCVNLIRHLKNCRWQSSTQRNTFARSAAGDGHYDLVDALRYAVREINFNKNPYPGQAYGLSIRELAGGGTGHHFNNSHSFHNTDPMEVYKKIFGRKKLNG